MTTILAVLWLGISSINLYQIESECWDVLGFGQAAVPAGTVPDNVEICVFLNTTHTMDLPGFPCGQYIDFHAQNFPSSPYQYGRLRVFPEPDTPSLGQGVRIGFIAWTMLVDQLPPGGLSLNEIDIVYISENNDVAYTKHILLDEYPSVIFSYEGFMGLDYEYEAHFVEFTTPHTSDMEWSHGSFEFQAPMETNIENIFLYMGVASLRIVGIGDPMPPPCIQGPSTPTATPTPTGIWSTSTPTSTPTGTWATPTPSRTPFPTSIQTTSIPTPSRTAIVLATLPLIDTPTPYPVVALPTLLFPLWIFPTIEPINTPPPLTIVFPTATPAATNTPFGGEEDGGELGDGVDEIASDVAMLATQWSGVIDAGYEQMALTRTVGITTWVESFNILVRGPDPVEVEQYAYLAPAPVVQAANTIATVVSLIKSLQLYAPSLWPVVLTLLISFSLVTGTIIIKVLINIVWRLLEWIRRLIELIPFAE